jgi:hypothetical protein
MGHDHLKNPVTGGYCQDPKEKVLEAKAFLIPDGFEIQVPPRACFS